MCVLSALFAVVTSALTPRLSLVTVQRPSDCRTVQFSVSEAQTFVCFKVKAENWTVRQPHSLCTVTRLKLGINADVTTPNKADSTHIWKDCSHLW